MSRSQLVAEKVHVALSLWPWAWTAFLYAAASLTARQLGHWPGCCAEAAKRTAPYGLGMSVKALGLFAVFLHGTAIALWVFLAARKYGPERAPLLSRARFVVHATVFVLGLAVTAVLLMGADPGRVLDWAVD